MSKRSLVGALCLTLLLGAAAAAQEDPGRIPAGVVGATKALTADEQQVVVRFIEFNIERLKTAKDPESSAAARNRLEEPYNQGGTEFFISFYDQALAGRLAGALGAEAWLNRMNSMLVAGRVKNGRIADAIKAGLGDTSSAVVYAAARAASSFTDPEKNKATTPEAKRPLVASLMDAMKREKNPFTLEFVFQALVNIGDAGALNAVLDRLIVVAHGRGKGAVGPLDGELAAISGVYNALANLAVQIKNNTAPAGAKLDEATLKKLVLVCVLYMEVAVNVIESKPDNATEQTALRMLDVCDIASQFSAKDLSANPQNKFKMGASIKGQSTNVVKLTILDWKETLKMPPFNFKPADLEPASK